MTGNIRGLDGISELGDAIVALTKNTSAGLLLLKISLNI